MFPFDVVPSPPPASNFLPLQIGALVLVIIIIVASVMIMRSRRPPRVQ